MLRVQRRLRVSWRYDWGSVLVVGFAVGIVAVLVVRAEVPGTPSPKMIEMGIKLPVKAGTIADGRGGR